MWISVLWEITLKCERTWTYILQTKKCRNNSSMTSSGYNYWSKIGNLASTTEQANLIALGKTAYI